MTYGFAHSPTDAISHHGLADGAGQSEADMGTIRLRLADAKGRKERVRITLTLIVNPSEVFGSQQADTFRKTSDGELPLGADSKFRAPPGAPA